MQEIINKLLNLKSDIVYLYCNQSFCFVNNFNIYIEDNVNRITFEIDNNNCLDFLCSFIDFIEDNKLILCWNIKYLFSFIRNKIGNKFNNMFEDRNILNKFIDLKCFEFYYLGINKDNPVNFEEVKKRFLFLKDFLIKNNYLMSIYNKLLIQVLPNIENSDIQSISKKSKIFSCYDYFQNNHRLKCILGDDLLYNPHGLSKEVKEDLTLFSWEKFFISIDYKSMEVFVLAYLTKDKNLIEMLKGDFYENLSIKIFKTNKYRDLAKDVFLKIVYGMGINSLSSILNISVDATKKIKNNIESTFSDLFKWFELEQYNIVENEVVDCFGSKRKLDKTYKFRNFLVQSPAALIAIERLNKLYDVAKDNLLMFCYDEYILSCDNQSINNIDEYVKVLTEPTKLFNLKLECKIDIKN